MDRRDFNRRLAGAVGALTLGSPLEALSGASASRATRSIAPALRVNGDRITAHLAALSEFGKNPYGGVSRLAYSDFDKAGREYVKGLMRDAGLEVSVDVAGNILGHRDGMDASLPPIWFGSHIDSVPDGGNYDGDVGVLSSIEAAQTLRENRVVTRHPINVVLFQNEEGGTYGSRAVVEGLSGKDLDLVARSGKTIREGITFIGGDPSKLSAPLRKRGDIAAYVELHIEQGGNLEAEHLDIGVVEGIVGISEWDVTVEGFANHAGTTAMDQRRDAVLAAARFADMVNRVVRSLPGRQVGTVGRMQAFPGAPNVIPGKVLLTLELRDLDARKTSDMYARVRAEAEEIGKATGCTFSYSSIFESTPAICDSGVQRVIESSAKSLGLTTKYMPSGAGHDAQHMARITSAGMIFVPSVGGISHAPKEYTKPQDVTNGANVLLQTVLSLDAPPAKAG
jgi:beta-ureidopropionase / N-carbamoyl-L-amino-acid hydrolase